MGRKPARKTARRPAKRRAEPSAPPLPAPSQAERAARSLEEMKRRELPFEQALLEDAIDLRATLRTVVAAFVPGFADWCFVDLLDEEGVPRRVEVAHADPGHALAAEEYRSIPLGRGWATPGAQAIRDRSPRIYSRLTDELMAWATWDERHLAALQATVPNSLMAIPLVARGTAIGALTLLRSGSSPPFWGDDLRRGVALAAPSALALDIARRFAASSSLSPTGGAGRVRGRASRSPARKRG
jgi:GAF domain-containing protein